MADFTILFRTSHAAASGKFRRSEQTDLAVSGSHPGEGLLYGEVPLAQVVEKVLELSKLDPSQLSQLMSTKEGKQKFTLPTSAVDPDTLLQTWDSAGRASPSALTDAEYERFLKGEHPIEKESRLYGAHLSGK